jgi:hypothetical protein
MEEGSRLVGTRLNVLDLGGKKQLGAGQAELDGLATDLDELEASGGGAWADALVPGLSCKGWPRKVCLAGGTSIAHRPLQGQQGNVSGPGPRVGLKEAQSTLCS